MAPSVYDGAASADDESCCNVVCRWQVPSDGVRAATATLQEMRILLDTLPSELTAYLEHNYGNRLVDLNEIYLQLGQRPECIFADPLTGDTIRESMGDAPCSQAHIDMFSFFFAADEDSQLTTTKRRGITNTLHRVSLITHPMRTPEKVIGVAVRVGRAMQGLLETMAWKSFLFDLAKERQSLLLIGKPGVGKTTVLREIARVLSEDRALNVVVIDKTCEVAGDGDTPHSAIGRARWMPVGKPNLQHVIMREAVENQSPHVIIVDEISTPLEVDAAKTISQRGVQLIATVHGRTLPEIINCKERGSLTGGCATVTLSGREAERRFDKRKQVQKRAKEPVFQAALELHMRAKWIFHPNVKDAADAYFEGEPSNAQELQPGKSVAVASIPGEGCFEYCRACGLGRTCSLHQGGHALNSENLYNGETTSLGRSLSLPIDGTQHQQPPLSPFPAPSNAQPNALSFSASGTRRRGRKKNWRAPRGSGRCHNCGQPGHYARDCPE